MKRWTGPARFAVGSAIGIGGLGLMGRSVFPWHANALITGVVMLLVGVFLALGTFTRRPKRK
ncbi:MAG: hypothetical protein ACYCOU_14565 [Sulfobacillus sp.]